MFVPDRPFETGLMFEGKARSLPKSGGGSFGLALDLPRQDKSEKLARYKHCSLLQKFVNYGIKKLMTMGSDDSVFLCH